MLSVFKLRSMRARAEDVDALVDAIQDHLPEAKQTCEQLRRVAADLLRLLDECEESICQVRPAAGPPTPRPPAEESEALGAVLDGDA